MKQSDFELLAKEGAELLAKNPCMRSCWRCNGTHAFLREADFPFWCFDCGHVYYKGMTITKYYDTNQLPKLINEIVNHKGTDLASFGNRK